MAEIRLSAWKEKDRAHYEITLGPKHHRVLTELAKHPKDGVTDRDLTFATELHMAAARRCELRDAGAVRRGGRRNGSWTWKLTDKGEELLSRLNHPSAGMEDVA